jgi:hypothetical protein
MKKLCAAVVILSLMVFAANRSPAEPIDGGGDAIAYAKIVTAPGWCAHPGSQADQPHDGANMQLAAEECRDGDKSCSSGDGSHWCCPSYRCCGPKLGDCFECGRAPY